MSQPVVVQGTPVRPGQGTHPGRPSRPTEAPVTTTTATTSNNNNNNHGEKQETKCNDPIFALLFYACIIAIVAVAAVYGPAALDTSTNNSGVNYEPYIIYVIVIVIISFFLAAGGMAVMMCIPETLIKVSLIFVVALAGVWAVLAFIAGQIFAGVIGIIFFLLSMCYAYMVWSRIPFASINLVTAITAVKANLGVTFYAYLFAAFGGLWSIAWSVAFVGVFNNTYSCNANGFCTDPNYGYLFLLFLAFFFGHQVFQYSIHAMTSGVVGTWWYEPSECGICGAAIHNSFLRTMTTSFGSICFGAFVVAVIQALRQLANSAQANGDGNICVCIAECLLACLASIIEYLNKWAFVFVGLYGFSYIKAAKSVFQLFRNRGWEAVIADDLVSNTLLLVSIVAGGIAGAIGVAIQAASGLFSNTDTGSINVLAYVFLLGFVVGLVVTSTMMGVIGSGVNAVIVLFAEAPAEFQQNYPELSGKMREIWSRTYPGSV